MSDLSYRRQSAGFFRWEAPGEPLTVYFHLNTVELLERDAMRAGKTVAAGILLGRKDAGRQMGLIVENYEPVPHATWKSTDSPFGDRRQLKGMIDLWETRVSRRMEVLGFYRSCNPGENTLNEDDLAVINAYSGDQGALFLLIEPGSGKSSNALLFFVKDGAAAWQWNLTPFSRGELARKGGTARPLEPERPSVPRPALGPAVQELEPPAAKEEPAKSTPQQARQLSIPPKWQWAIGSVIVALLLAMGLYQLLGHKHPRDGASVTEVDSDLGLKLERAGADWKLTWNPNAPGMQDASSGQLIVTDGSLHKIINLDASDLRAGNIVYSPLSDNVILKLQLNSDDPADIVSQTVRIIGGAAEGAAPVSPQDANLPADDPALANPPGAPAISAEELAAIEKQAGLSTPASVVRPSPAPVKGGTAAQANPDTTVRRPLVRLPEERLLVSKEMNASATEKAKSARVPSGSLTPAKPINPPALADVPATKVLKAEAERIPVLPAIAPLTSTAVVSSSPSVPRASRRGGTVQPAQLLSNVNPVYPSSARDDSISGAVELRFKIGTNGDVRDVSVVRGPAILAQAAVDAVRNRKYKPARVDGVPTETDASAIFDFKLN